MVAEECRRYGETWMASASALMVIVHARMHARTLRRNMQACGPLLACHFDYADSCHRHVPTPRKERIEQREKSYPWNAQAHTHNVSLPPRVAVKQNGLMETES